MKNFFKSITILCIFFIFVPLYGCENPKEWFSKNKSLSEKEKIEDFEYLYNVVNDNFPLLSINKNKYGIDWLSNKDKYTEQIKATKNDSEFGKVLTNILLDLHSSNSSLVPSVNAKALDSSSSMIKKIFARDSVIKRYKLDEQDSSEGTNNNNVEKSPLYNTITKDIIPKEMGYIRIGKLLDENSRKEDVTNLTAYLKTIGNYKTLVIDLRGNSGGDITYLSNFLFPMIINKTYSNSIYSFFMGGNLTENLLKSSSNGKSISPNIEQFDKKKMPNLTVDLTKNFKYFEEYKFSMSPKPESINFSGKIYILIDSSMNNTLYHFINWAKYSKLATLVGEPITENLSLSVPAWDSLPNSGYVFTLNPCVLINPDGSCLEQNGISPDIVVNVDGRYSDPNLLKDPCIKKILEVEKQQ